MSGRLDSNQRPPEPHSGALAKLRHAPILPYCRPTNRLRLSLVGAVVGDERSEVRSRRSDRKMQLYGSQLLGDAIANIWRARNVNLVCLISDFCFRTTMISYLAFSQGTRA